MKQSKAAIVHTVFTALFLALGALSFAMLLIFDIEVLSILSLPPAEGSEGFGQGIGLAVGAVLVILFSIATGVLSLIGIIISSTAVKRRFGGVKVFAIISLILEIIFLVLSVTSVIFVATGL